MELLKYARGTRYMCLYCIVGFICELSNLKWMNKCFKIVFFFSSLMLDISDIDIQFYIYNGNIYCLIHSNFIKFFLFSYNNHYTHIYLSIFIISKYSSLLQKISTVYIIFNVYLTDTWLMTMYGRNQFYLPTYL